MIVSVRSERSVKLSAERLTNEVQQNISNGLLIRHDSPTHPDTFNGYCPPNHPDT